MKKFTVLAVIIVLFFTSCASTESSGSAIVFDFNDSLSGEQVAIIHYRGVDIVEYNGMNVGWKVPSSNAFVELRIPGGDTAFVFNGVMAQHPYYTTYENVPFKFKFENGKVYTMRISVMDVSIWNGKQLGGVPPNNAHLVTYNMSKGQALIWQDGKSVRN